jgi:hypothetical protein
MPVNVTDAIPRLAVAADKHAEALTRLLATPELPDDVAQAALVSRDAAVRLMELAKRSAPPQA